MPPKKSTSKRRSRRKARTDVSSASSSSSDSSRAASPASQAHEEAKAVEETALNHASEPAEARFTVRHVDPEKAFCDFYLRQATKEFANDLDKLRSASDFNNKSIPLLVHALEQGIDTFTKEERMKAGEAAAASGQ